MTLSTKSFEVFYFIVISIFIFMMNYQIFFGRTSFTHYFFELSICLNATLPHWIFFSRVVMVSAYCCIMTFSTTVFCGIFSAYSNLKWFTTKMANYFNSIIIPRNLSFFKGASSHVDSFYTVFIGSQQEIA